MHTMERRNNTIIPILDAADKVQRSLAHASVWIDDQGQDAIAFLHEAAEHALAVAWMAAKKAKELESTRA